MIYGLSYLTFAIDIDDVCLQLLKNSLKHYNVEYKDELEMEHVTDYDVASFTKPECGKKFYDFFEPYIYNDVEVIEYALWGVQSLRNMGHRVTFLTSDKFSSGGVKLKALNNRGFDVLEKDYFESSDKSLDGSPVKYDWLVDDNMNNVLSAQGKGILYTQPWNIKYDYEPRVNDWIDLVKNIDKIANKVIT